MDIKTAFLKEVEKLPEDGKKSINIGIDGIRDKKFTYFLINTLQKRENILVEINLAHIATDYKEIVNFAKELSDSGINMIFDNVNLNDLNVNSLLQLHPKYIKIPIKSLKESYSDENLIKMLRLIEESMNIKIVATYIETQEEYEKAKELGIRCMQGFYEKLKRVKNEKDIRNNR